MYSIIKLRRRYNIVLKFTKYAGFESEVKRKLGILKKI